MKITKRTKVTSPILLAFCFALILIVVGYYLGSNISSFKSEAPSSTIPSGENQKPSPTPTSQVPSAFGEIIYSSGDAKSKSIYAYSLAEQKSRKFFTDSDEDLKLKNISSVKGDGSKILVVLGTTYQDFGGQLALVSTDGRASKKILQDNFASPQTPVMSPDGEKVLTVFFSNAEQDTGGFGFTLYSQNKDGSSKRQISHNTGGIFSAVWNEDGTKIAYFTNEGAAGYKLMVTDAKNPKPSSIKDFDQQPYGLDWKMNKLAFVLTKKGPNMANSAELYLMDDNGKNLVQLTDNGEHENYPVFSPDSQWLAYFSATFANGNINLNQTGEVKIINLATGKSEKIADGLQVLGWLK